MLVDVEAGEVFPARSVCVAVTDHTPSVSDGRSHDDAVPITYVHDRVVAPLVAVTVITSPAIDPDTGADTVGVASDVRSSLDDDPVSDDTARSTGEGAAGAVVSTVSDSGELGPLSFPASSVNVDVTDHVASVSDGRTHDDAVPTTYVHDHVVVPSVARIVTTSPSDAGPTRENCGVASDVRSSVDDEPVSDETSRSGAVEPVAGAVASMIRFIAGPAADTFPAGSVDVADTAQVPSVSGGRSHDVATPTVYVHDRVVVPFVAVTVTTSPGAPSATPTAGVASDVRSSVVDEPVSDAVRRSTDPGAPGASVSTVIVVAGPATEVFPSGSAAVAVTVHEPPANPASGQLDVVAERT